MSTYLSSSCPPISLFVCIFATLLGPSEYNQDLPRFNALNASLNMASALFSDPGTLRGEEKTSALQAYDKSAFKQKATPTDEKGNVTAEVEPVAFDKDGEIIRESDYSPEEYKKLLRKIDRYLLPLMWFCYGVQQTDKTSLGTQAIFGLREDTHLHGQQYSWLTTIFYITYLCGEFPSNFLLQRWALGRSLSIYMLCWGTS